MACAIAGHLVHLCYGLCYSWTACASLLWLVLYLGILCISAMACAIAGQLVLFCYGLCYDWAACAACDIALNRAKPSPHTQALAYVVADC